MQGNGHSPVPVQVTPPSGGLSYMRLFFAVRAWSEKMFGDDLFRGPRGPLLHLEKEAREAVAAWDIIKQNGGVLNRAMPDQLKAAFVEELADIQILLFDAMWRAGLHPHHLLQTAELKMVKNIQRAWPAPTPDGPVEHVRAVSPLTLEELERRLADWHQQKYGRLHVIPHATLAKLFEELGEFGEAVRNVQAKGNSESLAEEVAVEGFDVLCVVAHLVRHYGGSLAAIAPRKLAVIFERLKPQPDTITTTWGPVAEESNSDTGGV